jgi:cell division protein FtsB
MSRSITRVEILRYSPSRRVRGRILAGVIVIVAMCALCWIAWSRGAAEAASLQEQLRALELVHQGTEEEVGALEQQVMNLRKGAEIDAAAAAEARSDLARARSEVSRLEQEVSLFESLIDSSVKTRGLVIHEFLILDSGSAAAGHYRYRIVLLQRAQRHVELTGSATMSIVGMLDGKERRFELPELGPNEADRFRPLKLTYFQVIEGDIALPKGLLPQRITVTADIKTGKPQRIQRSFDWVVEEK